MKKVTYLTILPIGVLSVSQAIGQITYVDAIAGAGGNTRSSASTQDDVSWLNGIGTSAIADNVWTNRPDFGTGDNLFQSIQSGAGDAPELTTTITGIPDGEYQIYVFYAQRGGGVNWQVDAAIEGDELVTYDESGNNGSVLASTLTYATETPDLQPNAAIALRAAVIGRVTITNGNGTVNVIIDNTAVGDANRAWYDGVGFQEIGDSDNDGMEDTFEALIINADPDDAITSIADVLPGDDFDNDNATNLVEFNNQDTDQKTDPTNPDTDNDTLLDGDEISGTSNTFNAMPTDPTMPDTDEDGVSDLEENGSLNTQFANAATNPNEADTDGDGMADAYELANNTPGSALNPNDNGTTDAAQAATGDIDGDTLENFNEFLGFDTNDIQTRADLPDTDGDGLTDNQEDGFGSFLDETQYGSNPTNTDTDGDCIPDNQEAFFLSIASPNTPPYNTDPNDADTDDDGFSDFFEATLAGTNGGEDGDLDVPVQANEYTLIENFEGSGMTIGQTFVGINGWQGDAPAALVVDEPIAGGDQVGRFVLGDFGDNTRLFLNLGKFGAQILEGNTGTLFFQLYTDTLNLNNSFGLSDLGNPIFFTAYEAQFAIAGTENTLIARDGEEIPRFMGGNQPLERWMNVWIVADNELDEIKIYIQSPDGLTGQVDITNDPAVAPYTFRNGTTSDLATLLLLEASGGEATVLVDNFYIHPQADAHLVTPAALKPAPPVGDRPQITNVAFVGDNLEITFSPGGTGFILTSSDDLETAFAEETGATYDDVDTFTVPASSQNALRDFFRIEGAPAPAAQ